MSKDTQCHLCKGFFNKDDMRFTLSQSIRLNETTYRCKPCQQYCQDLHDKKKHIIEEISMNIPK